MNHTAVPLVGGGDAPWDAYPPAHSAVRAAGFNPVDPDPDNAGGAISIDSVLPDDITERILSFLPVGGMLRASSVCRRWHRIVRSRRFLWAAGPPQKPWYFMFTSNEDASGYAYDPALRKWYRLDLPCVEKSSWLASSSCGLVCFMDNDTASLVFVCNPITRDWRRIPEPPGARAPDYSTLAVSVDRESPHRYTVAVAKTRQAPAPADSLQWGFSIHTYDSETGSWVTSVDEALPGWRGGDESAVCGGVFYCLVHRTNVHGSSGLRHALIAYDLSAGESPRAAPPLMCTLIPAPCFLTCGRLMNVKDRLVMVGGIGKYDRPDIIKGISVWEIRGREWREVARMPHRFFQGFGELDDVFASSGSDGLIFIQSFGATALLVFDMNQKHWRWSAKCPVTKRFPLQLFSGFCFEPRLEVAS